MLKILLSVDFDVKCGVKCSLKLVIHSQCRCQLNVVVGYEWVWLEMSDQFKRHQKKLKGRCTSSSRREVPVKDQALTHLNWVHTQLKGTSQSC